MKLLSNTVQRRVNMFLSLFQTASGSWHTPSILTAVGWLLGSVVSGIIIITQLAAQRAERTKTFAQEQQRLEELKDARAKINELEKKTKLTPLNKRIITYLNEIDSHVLSALRSGTTKFEIELESHQLPDLKRLYAEDSTHKYISSLKVTEAYLRLSGSYTQIQLELMPTLLQ